MSEPDYDCYEANFSIPARGPCVGCEFYKKCREILEEEELYGEDEEW